MEKITEFINKHPRAVFWIRFVFWVIFAAGLPFAFIAWRYDIFKPAGKYSLTGWGLFAVLIIVIFAIALVKYLYKGLKPGVAKQCISGIACLIIPLVAFYLLISAIEDSIALFKQALGCVILCELCALPINPMPVWAYEQQKELKENERKGTVDYLLDGFFSRGGK